MLLPSPMESVRIHVEADYPLMYILTYEESRVQAHLTMLAATLQPARNIYIWSTTEGYNDGPDGPGYALGDPVAAIDLAIETVDAGLFILKDFHAYLKARPDVVRRLRDAHSLLKGTGKTILILAPILTIPPEMEKQITIVDYPLPDMVEIGEILADTVETRNMHALDNLNAQDSEALIRSFLGLTAEETSAVAGKILATRGTFEISAIEEVIEEKRQLLRKSEIVEFVPNTIRMRHVGGLNNFKKWAKIRARGFTKEARDFGLPVPKGILITGISGCGKSLVIQALAAHWRLPLMRLDMGRIFSDFGGSPEESLRRAILTVEAVAPAVLWIDEIEMGISVFSDSVESGSTSRIFASFLTWMQEKKAPVFTAATANDIDRLPPEMIRKGRFDEIFFVDLPDYAERAEIFRIHLEKRGKKASTVSIEGLAKSAGGYTGAEIETAIISGLYAAFSEHRELEISDIYRALNAMVPLSVTMKEEITKTKRWADNRAVRAN
ncbi:MAG: AAA family ATPase [Candidatus Lernaella stagnicola]|nr:AAA family ATPase [Candidatus Lernaella stagnicola]